MRQLTLLQSLSMRSHGGALLGSVMLAGVAVGVGQWGGGEAAVAHAGGGNDSVGRIGPDVMVGALPNISKYGTVGGISAYALGTTSCNVGDDILLWCDTNVQGLCNNTQHPVIAQNMYRLKDGRFEQIGMSWLKHGFCALSGSLCDSCNSDPFGCDALGVGCSDPYDSSLNGSQGGLGPRSQVNPVTGVFPYRSPRRRRPPPSVAACRCRSPISRPPTIQARCTSAKVTTSPLTMPLRATRTTMRHTAACSSAR